MIGRSPLRCRTSRLLHAGAWWLWALGLAAAASRSTNPLLLALIVAVTALAVTLRAGDTPWVAAYAAAFRLAAFVLVIRVVFGIVFGFEIPGTVVLTLPEIPVPEWAAGVRIGGAVTIEQIALAFYDGLRLATIIICLGAANALSSPTRLLKSVPGALYELGVAVVVAMSLAPQLILDAARVRDARRLRGRSTRGAAGVVGLVGPVLDGSLRRSLDLAAAMDTRGYGRTAHVPVAVRRVTSTLVLAGVVGITIGIYGLLDGSSSPWIGLPMLGAGMLLGGGGLLLGGRRTARSRYRPDAWRAAEWWVALGGWAAAGSMWFVATSDPALVEASVTPLTWPALPLLPALGLAVAALAAVAAPAPPATMDLAPDEDAPTTSHRPGITSNGTITPPAPDDGAVIDSERRPAAVRA